MNKFIILLGGIKMSAANLPIKLKNLVKQSVTILGQVVREEAGEKAYQRIESIREKMVLYRSGNVTTKDQILKELYEDLDHCSKNEKHQVAQSFSLMLELINVCEAAYRTYKLRYSDKANTDFQRQDNTMVFVLTAHPTEARTPANMELFARIQNILIDILEQTAEQDYLESIVKHNLKLAWLLPITRHKKPEVIDEANHLFSIIFRKDIFYSILRADRDLGTIRVRTWVGGDKDGHPGVDEVVMMDCLQASRNCFIETLHYLSIGFVNDLAMLDDKYLNSCLKKINSDINSLEKIRAKDSTRINNLQSNLDNIGGAYEKLVGARSPRLEKINAILKLFPGLVIPIELREDSEIIEKSLGSKTPLAMDRMLRKLSSIADGFEISRYAQSLIISMCESYSDIENTIKLSKKSLGGLFIPVIPLFETAKALELSNEIISELIGNKEFTKVVNKSWGNKLEVMLGYSDSSKGMGVLPSRIAIAKTMRSLDKLISENNFIPVFFHGSGGSVDRGGGSLKEQTAWWPKSALHLYKATIQGEMVERTFTSSEVTLSSIDKVMRNFKRAKTKKGYIKINKDVERFAERVKSKYVATISDPKFFEMVEAATPYSYLKVLKLGSRPTKRSSGAAKSLDFSSIRAIPWILCWTQTRILFPTWWGIGSAWKEIENDKEEVARLQKSYETSYLFASFLRTLGFTLSKVDTSIFRLYLNQSELSTETKEKVFNEFNLEYKNTLKFLKHITGEKNTLWHKPWLQDSIKLRSSMIHPLNVLQIQGNKSGDEDLVQKTVAGISSGMMTTG